MYSIFELSLPVCAIVFSLLLIIVYFTKRRINLLENKMYGIMLISVLIDSILVMIEKLLVINKDLTSISRLTQFVVGVLNKFDAIILIVITTCLFIYIFIITFKPSNKYLNKIIGLSIFVNMIFILMIFVLDVYLITNGEIISISGSILYPTYIGCGLYVLFSIVITLLNIKKITRKYIPLIITIFVFILLILIFTFNPYVTVISILLTFVNYVMYFTIENPDVKLLEEVHNAKKIADSANEEKTMFLYNMMGEVRSIASSINLSSNMILDSNDIEETKEYARDIISYNNKFYNMSNDIYNIDEIELSNIKVINNKYDTKLFFKKIVSNYKNLLEDSDIEFRVNIDSNLPSSLCGDSINLKEVLVTILDNACKYTEKGFVEFNLNTIIKHDICRLIINIEDSGVGIKADEIEKSINKNKKADYNGSLYNARKLITVMGGSLIITSDYNKGTKVTIVLDQKINNKKQNINDNYGSYLHDINVLLVDDNISSQKLINKIFTKNNINLEAVGLAKECLDKIRNKEKYDLILIDEDMPYINGNELMKKLKLIRGFKIPVVLLTKNKSMEYIDEYKKIGFSNYVIKPINKYNLIEVISSIVDKNKKS